MKVLRASTWILIVLMGVGGYAGSAAAEAPKTQAGDVLVSGRIATPMGSASTISVVPGAEYFVSPHLAVGGYVSAGYAHYLDKAGRNGLRLGAGTLAFGPTLTGYFLNGMIRPLLGLSVGYEHLFIDYSHDADGVVVFPKVGVLFALSDRLTISLDMGYSFTFANYSGKKEHIVAHAVPIELGVGVLL